MREQYWYQLFVDDLPVWGMVGEFDAENERYYLFTHMALRVLYNGNRIIEVSLASEAKGGGDDRGPFHVLGGGR